MQPVMTRPLSQGMAYPLARQNAGRRSSGGASPPSYSAEATALFARMATQPSNARKTAIDTYIVALKADGTWDRLDRLYVLAAHEAATALLNWKSTSYSPLVAFNGPTFTVDRGYTGISASLTRLESATNVLAAPITANNLSLGVYCLTGTAESKPQIGGGAVEVRARTTLNQISSRMCDASANSTTTVATGVGLAASTTKVGAEATTKQVFKNGVQLGTDITRATIVALPVQNQAILGSGSAGAYTDLQIAMGFWGQTMTAAQMLTLYNATLAYLQHTGAQ